jgi:hypothetical protein
MSKLNVDRMRKRVSIPTPAQAAAVQGEDEYPEGSVVIRDAAGRVIRVLDPNRGRSR